LRFNLPQPGVSIIRAAPHVGRESHCQGNRRRTPPDVPPARARLRSGGEGWQHLGHDPLSAARIRKIAAAAAAAAEKSVPAPSKAPSTAPKRGKRKRRHTEPNHE
jgi:hypothetical protein